ncbi:DUF3426 domain-containing protein [Ferruginivarius sediminum]|nr:DUF3426 domain-containing protein [Ferruginivarius sediminum]
MILTCPSCGARFRIDADKLSPRGRSVRCSKCQHVWHQTPPDAGESQAASDTAADETPAAVPEAEGRGEFSPLPEEDPIPQGLRAAPEEGEPTPEEDLERFGAARRRRALHAEREPEPVRRRAGPLGWLVLLMVVAAIVAGLWFGRNELVARVPQAAALYDLVGLPVSAVAPDLELRDVSRRRSVADGKSLLTIEGRIINTADASREVPGMRVVLFDAGGNELSRWTFKPEAKTLPPGGETHFSTSRADPPDEARELSLTFVLGSPE